MNVWLIISIVSLVICTVVFTVQIIQIVKFMINCSREGVRAVKFSFNVPSVIVIAITIGFIVGIGYFFGKADYYRKGAQEAEMLVGTGFEEYFAKQQEEKRGIIILDPEKYYLDNLNNLKELSQSNTMMGIGMVIWSVDSILSIISLFNVITGVGLRNSRIKDTIPIFAEYDRQNGKIIVKANDLNSKTDTLLTFSANPRNLASLGQYIVWDEPTTQEVIQ